MTPPPMYIKDVLSAAECGTALDLLWTELEASKTGIARGEPETWKVDDQIFGNNWGHSEFLWCPSLYTPEQ